MHIFDDPLPAAVSVGELIRDNNKLTIDEVEECIIQECESAGLSIWEDEDLAEERGYDRAFEVVNPRPPPARPRPCC